MSWPITPTEPHDYLGPSIGLKVEAGEIIRAPQGNALVHLHGCTDHGLAYSVIEAFAAQCTSPETWGYDLSEGFSVYCIATPEQATIVGAEGARFDGVYLQVVEDGQVAARNMLVPPLPQAITERLRDECRRAMQREWELVSTRLREANYARRSEAVKP